MMTSVALLPLVGCLFLLGLSLCERNGHLENTIPEATDKCYFNSCGELFTCYHISYWLTNTNIYVVNNNIISTYKQTF